MDITDGNILMCKEATQIKETWQPKINDMVYGGRRHLNETGFITWTAGLWLNYKPFDNACHTLILIKDVVWLPRVGQYIDMLPNFRTPMSLIYHLQSIMSREIGAEEYFTKFTSWEQLMLAFVMRRNHLKKWDKKNWIEIKT